MEDKWFYEEYTPYLSHLDNLPENKFVKINNIDELINFIKAPKQDETHIQ